MPQSVKERFTQDDPGTGLHPGARASASARGGSGRRGQERVIVPTRMGAACCSDTLALWRILSHGCANVALVPWRLRRVPPVTPVICKQSCLRSSGTVTDTLA